MSHKKKDTTKRLPRAGRRPTEIEHISPRSAARPAERARTARARSDARCRTRGTLATDARCAGTHAPMRLAPCE